MFNNHLPGVSACAIPTCYKVESVSTVAVIYYNFAGFNFRGNPIFHHFEVFKIRDKRFFSFFSPETVNHLALTIVITFLDW